MNTAQQAGAAGTLPTAIPAAPKIPRGTRAHQNHTAPAHVAYHQATDVTPQDLASAMRRVHRILFDEVRP